ncbi:MAG: SMC-Scp complex subunit ScpB [Ornithinimicrobium sp.]
MSEPEQARSTVEEAHPAPDPPDSPELAVHLLPGGLRAAVEAVLMVIDEPVGEAVLAAALEVPIPEVSEVVRQLAQEYEDQERGFMLRRYAGGWRIYSRPECAPAVERFLLGGAQARLSQAALETLAVVAYRQPISRSRISAVRGVNVDGVVRTLLARGLIGEIAPENPSAAMLFGTTDLFLQRMGVSDLDELPALAPYLPTDDVLDDLAAEGLA